MLLAASGAVLLVSGLGGKSIGDVLKGEFGKLEVKNPNIGSKTESEKGEHGPETGAAALTTAGGEFGSLPAAFQTVPSQSTFAPSPVNLNRHFVTWASLDREIREHKLTKAQVTQRIKEIQEGK